MTVRAAGADRRALRIVGGATKAWYGRQMEGEALNLAGHRGVVSYEPSELVITARAGTPVARIEALLAQNGQMLAFEPPVFGGDATLGGAVASGLAGPRRPFTGAVRDFVLGVTILDGHARTLRFGGSVFKNVAGFDAFRLMAGALGCLGVLLDVSLRVMPRPREERCLAFDEDWPAAARRLAGLMRRPLPLSGAFHDGERLHLRLSGGEAAVAEAAVEIGGDVAGPEMWNALRELRVWPLQSERLWRLSVPRGAALEGLGGERVWDWAGAQLWLATDAAPNTIREAALAAGGHATLFRGAGPDEPVFEALHPALLALHQRLKRAFDPARVFNPGRMYEDL